MNSAGDGTPEHRPSDEPAPRQLSHDEATELAGHLADLAGAQLPLSPGLRAAAAELPAGSRLARAMQGLAAALERGQPLERALVDEQDRLPTYLGGLIAAGVHSGRLGLVLEQFVTFRRFAADVRRSIRAAVSYPLLLLILTAGLFLLLLFVIAPQLAVIQRDFSPVFNYHQANSHYRPPENIRVLQWLSVNMGVLLPALAGAVGLMAVAAWMAGAARVRWALNRLPCFGPLGRYGGLAEWSQLLRLLIENNVALPEALRWTADGISDADVAAGSRRLAERVETGQPLALALDGLPQFTSVMRPLIAWGEASGSLPAALDSVGELCLRRVELRSSLVRGVVPPVAFLIVAAGVLVVWSIISMVITLISSFYGTPPETISLQASGVFSLMLLGVSILISVRLVYSDRPATDDILRALMKLIAYMLLSMAVIGFFLIAGGGVGAWLGLFALGVWGATVFRFRQSQQAALLNLLTLALRRGLPLQAVVRAFAAQESGVVGRRASQLADRLDAGQSLAEAANQIRRLLPPEAILALELGRSAQQTATLLEQGAVARIMPAGDRSRFWGASLSLFALGTFGAGAVIFAAKKIAPAFEFIFHDFHRPLPPLTKEVFYFTQSPLTIAVLGVIAACLIALAFYLGLVELGWIRFGAPILDRLFAPRHSAVVLRWLATTVRNELPLEPTLELLAKRYPKQLIRNRVRGVVLDQALGCDWIASLRSRRLIRRADAAVLTAAARAGNLPWAFDEAAAGALRQLTYRLQALSQIFFPLLILFLGGLVMLFAVGYLLPLVELIDGLSKV